MKRNILFVCKHNRFRSKIAEAYFNIVNENPNLSAKSGGIFPGGDLDPNVYRAAKEFGITVRGKPRGIDIPLLKWQDMIVVVADNVPPVLFKNNLKYHKPLLVWKIRDSESGNAEAVNNTIKEIIKRVDQLVRRLK